MSFVAVHLGAGSISPSRRAEYSKLASEACRLAVKQMSEGVDSLASIAECMALLEDSHLTNAGVGSNLTADGTVELDASVMCGKDGAYGSVAAVSDICNPCKVAAAVLKESRNGMDPNGRVCPLMLCGDGAQCWAKNHGFHVTDANKMITARSRRQYEKYREVKPVHETGSMGTVSESLGDHVRLDTVGAVCIDRNGDVCAAASSGGVLLKHRGRVGQAAMFGCGCWAEKYSLTQSGSNMSVAVTTSGTGEHLIQSLMAKTCADEISVRGSVADGVRKSMDAFCSCRRLVHVAHPQGGALAMGCDESCVEIAWGHATPSFFIGYMAEKSRKPFVTLSQNQTASGFVVEGRMVRL